MNNSERRSHAKTKQTETLSNEEKIALLNDEIRCKGIGGRTMITSGVNDLGHSALLQIRMMIATFDKFTEDNNPHGERDFGMIKYSGETIFWKIDYYDNELEFGSPDPTNPDITTRVLTIMLDNEY